MRNIHSAINRWLIRLFEALVTLLYMAGYAIRNLYRAIER